MVRITTFFLFLIGALLLSVPLITRSQEIRPGNAPLSQPLVREGDLAVRLVEALKLGRDVSEAEAESILFSIEISPKNGWIADYPVTPDIVGELQASLDEAAGSGASAIGKEAALKVLQDVLSEYSLFVTADNSAQDGEETSAPDYPDVTEMRDYYYDEGPPVVTYYTPPPDYAYLYIWISYPFSWRGKHIHGFFMQKRFHVWAHGPERGHGEYVSNYFQDPGTGKLFRIDPRNRSQGGAIPEMGGMGRASPSVQSGAIPVVPNNSQIRTIPRQQEEYRGYSVSRPSTTTHSSAFERSGNSSVERRASDRGFQSRSSAGQVPRGSSGSGGSHSAGGGGFHGGGLPGGARH